jgi:tetratricopeptide (TPR) repeat protein
VFFERVPPAALPRRLAILATALVALLLQSPAAAAPEATSAPERALELHDEARALYADGRYRDAIDKLEEAVRLDPDAKLLYYNLGLIQEKLGELDEALGHYRKCLELEPDADERVKIAHIIKRLEGARAHEPDAPPASAPAPSDAPSQPPGDQGGDGLLVTPWVFVTGALALSAAAVGTGLAVHAANLDPGGEAMTSMEVSVDDLRSDAAAAHDYAIGADAAFIIAGAAAAVTLVLAAVTAGRSQDAARQPLAWRF